MSSRMVGTALATIRRERAASSSIEARERLDELPTMSS